MQPAIGQTIITKGVVLANNTDEHPGIITRTWGGAHVGHGVPLVNVTVFPDLAPPHTQGSIALYPNRAAAEAEQARVLAIGDNAERYKARGMSGPLVAFYADFDPEQGGNA